jgi:hypothetical protein
MNPLFPVERRFISRAELLEASIKDWNDFKQLEADVDSLFSELKKAPEQKRYSEVLDLREPFERLIFRAAEIGDIANRQSEALRHVYKTVEQTMRDGCPIEHKAELESLLAGSQQYRNTWTNQFVKQMGRADTPIKGPELLPSLLTEDVETVQLFASTLEEANRKSAYELAVTLISDVQNKGYVVPQAEEKLQALRSSE